MSSDRIDPAIADIDMDSIESKVFIAGLKSVENTAFIILSRDYSAMEARVIIEALRNAPGPVVMDFEGEGSIPGDERRLWPLMERFEANIELQERHKEVKQNGRSAAYLRHDKTKRWR